MEKQKVTKGKRGELTGQALSTKTIDTDGSDFSHLSSFDRGIGHLARRPRTAVYAAVALCALLAWAWLAVLAASVKSAFSLEAMGPGMAALEPLLEMIPQSWRETSIIKTLGALCAPGAAGPFETASLFLAVAMWFAMSVAMMLPSAAPMLHTYADIADLAEQKGENTVPLRVLAAGYLAVWLAFAASAAMMQNLMITAGLAVDPSQPTTGAVAGVILLGAGLYQFSSFKNACLEKCRNPFSTLFGLWTDRPAGIFKLGVEQGLFCLGCCWALMLVMFAVGTMNLAWMALFTLFAILEKSGSGKSAIRLAGCILIIWGGTLIALAGCSHLNPI